MADTRRPPGTGSVYQDNRGRWVAALDAGYTRAGTRRRIRRIAKSKREAQQALAQLRRDITDGIDQSTTTTVKTWADRWLDIAAARVRPKTFNTHASTLRRWIVPAIGRKRLNKITPADVRSVSQAMITAGLSPSSAQRAHRVLLKMLGDAIAEGYDVPRRALLVPPPSRGESERDAIPLPDALSILQAAALGPDASRWVAAMLQAMRPAECRGLTWDCVDLERGSIDVSWQLATLPYRIPRDRASGFRVPVGYTARHLVDGYHLVRPKTAKGRRVIPLVPWMTQALAAWRETGPSSPYGLVWPGERGRPMRETVDREHWRALCGTAAELACNRPAGAPEWGGPYDLYSCRHTTVTMLLELGVDASVIMAITGHAARRSMDPYAHVRDGRTLAALTSLAGQLGLTVPQIQS